MSPCPHYDRRPWTYEHIKGLPWGWHFNPHTYPIPTGIPMVIPLGIPIPTAALAYQPHKSVLGSE